MMRRLISLVCPLDTLRPGVLRTLLLCIAVAGYAANGAQAHIVAPQNETVEVRLCGAHGDRIVEMTFGDEDAPVRFTDDSCCGPCLLGGLPALAQFTLPRPAPAGLPRTINRAGAAPLIRFSIWPGAPPHGPPAHLEDLT